MASKSRASDTGDKYIRYDGKSTSLMKVPKNEGLFWSRWKSSDRLAASTDSISRKHGKQVKGKVADVEWG